MARQLSEEEREERETLRRLFGWGRPESDDPDDISLSELSEWEFGFNVYERFPDGKDRMNFVVSDEAAELRALMSAQSAKAYEEHRVKMTKEECRIDDLQTELLFLQLVQIDLILGR